MLEGHFRLTPETGARMKAAIDAAVQRTFRARRTDGTHETHEAYAADALTGRFDEQPAKAAVAGTTVHVVVDHAALVRGTVLAGERCEVPGVGPVNVEWVRGLLGDAFVTALVKKGRDITTVAHFGRHIPTHLRTAMIVGGRECVVEGCHNRGYLELDHREVDFANGGPTAWWNLDWECSTCHASKTQRWELGPRNPTTRKRTLTPPPKPRNAPP